MYIYLVYYKNMIVYFINICFVNKIENEAIQNL